MITWRTPVAVAAVLAGAGAVLYALAPLPHRERPEGARTIVLPAKQPAADAPDAAGWVWPDDVPGFRAGDAEDTFNLSRVQPVELQAAQLAAARSGLDPDSVRVVSALRPGPQGLFGVLAAASNDTSGSDAPCLAAILPGDAPVAWRCPGRARPTEDLADSRVLAAAGHYRFGDRHVLDVAGVARGDVTRIVADVPGFDAPWTIYERGRTWGQFEGSWGFSPGRRPPRLLVYSHGRLVETVRLDLAAGEEPEIR